MKKAAQKLLPVFLFLFIECDAQPFGYDYVKEITIQASQIPDGTALASFPFLFKVTDPDMRTVANGGHVRNSNGHDILFYLDFCNIKLDHQLESYDPVTGAVSAWVRMPSLSTTENTDLYVYYGNDTVSLSTSTTAVWDANYSGVWHLSQDPTGTAPQMSDGTSNARHGTTFGGMTSANLITGKVGNALSFDEVNDYVRVPDFLYGQELTVSFWFNMTEATGNGYQYLFSHGQWATQNSLNVYMGEDNITTPGETHNLETIKTVFRDNNDANNFDTLNAGNTWVDGNWHYYTMRIQDFGGASIYIDGILRTQYSVWGANTFNPGTNIFFGGREDLNAQRFFGGSLDEVRISTAWRTSNWILTEFNNQNDPSSFFSIGEEVTSVSFCITLPLKMVEFNAVRSGTHVKLDWKTDDQAGSTNFSIERSADGSAWKKIGSVSGSMNFIDSFPVKGISFYRVAYKQGTDGYTSVIRKVEAICCDDEINIYPNPSPTGMFTVSFQGQEKPVQAILLDPAGIAIQRLRINKENNSTMIVCTGNAIKKGLYFLRFEYNSRTVTKKILMY